MNFFVVIIIDIHNLNLGPLGNLEFLAQNSLKMCFSTIKENYFMYLKKKPIPYERKIDFIVGHCIVFSDFFCLVMSYESQT